MEQEKFKKWQKNSQYVMLNDNISRICGRKSKFSS